MPHDSRCIAVFDSGIGGLTVVREIHRHLPAEDVVYFGDTARVPYGIKSSETVTRFAREICEFLLRFDPKMIVVACNTASAAALPHLEDTVAVPLCGVVEPGAREAVLRANGHTIAVIATEATIQSDAYRKAMNHYQANVRVIQRPCPLFVPLVEEGRPADDAIVQSVVREYLDPIVRLDPKVVVLGCTHYPLLRPAIAAVTGPDVVLVDSGEQTARAVAQLLTAAGALNEDPAEAPKGCPRGAGGSHRAGRLSCYVSDNPQRFRELGQRFLDRPIVDVTWVSPEQYLADRPMPSPAATPH